MGQLYAMFFLPDSSLGSPPGSSMRRLRNAAPKAACSSISVEVGSHSLAAMARSAAFIFAGSRSGRPSLKASSTACCYRYFNCGSGRESLVISVKNPSKLPQHPRAILMRLNPLPFDITLEAIVMELLFLGTHVGNSIRSWRAVFT